LWAAQFRPGQYWVWKFSTWNPVEDLEIDRKKLDELAEP